MNKLRYLLVVCIAFLMIGCANKMALTKGQDNIDLSKKSLALFTLKVSNQVQPGYQPNKLLFDIDGTYWIEADLEPPHKSQENSFSEYLLSFDLTPGINKFNKIKVFYRSFLVGGGAVIPLDFNVDIKPNSVRYLGHIDAVMRAKKNDNEESTGSPFPLIDQAVTGYHSGTWDIFVEDKFDEDMKWFISEYPGLQKVKVENSIFPQWIRPENRNTKKD
jgi:hypothetical protein